MTGEGESKVSTVIEDLKRLEDRILEHRGRDALYPVVRQLVSDGLLHKDGRGLWPVSP